MSFRFLVPQNSEVKQRLELSAATAQFPRRKTLCRSVLWAVGLCLGCMPTTRAGNLVAWGSGPATSVPTNSNVIAIAAGSGGHALALLRDHTILGWGLNAYGETTCPLDLSNVVAVAAGGFHSLVLLSDGTVRAWGRNNRHQCDVPPGLTNVVALRAGEFHNLALLSDGCVTNWGAYWNPDLGYLPLALPAGLTNVAAIASGFDHDLFLLRDGTVVTNGFYGTHEIELMPNLTNVLAVTTSGDADMALTANGLVVWSAITSGQNAIPLGLTNISAIASGPFHELALLSNGTVRAWGKNDDLRCAVPWGLSNVVAVAGGGTFSLALVNDTTVPSSPPFSATAATFKNGVFSISVPTVTGLSYRLEYKNSLEDVDWIPLDSMDGDGEQKVLTDSTASVKQRFYRVRQE